MAKEKETSDRENRWKEHLAKYEKSNPKKYADKKERGELNDIPDSFI